MPFLPRYRALLGLVSVASIATFFALPSAWPAAEAGYWLIRACLASLWLLGLSAICGSPYWKIVYREAPLKRALTGVTELDERELSLRDRANGLTYYLFFVANLLLLLGGSIAVDAGWVTIDGGALIGMIVPYAFFAMTLPVIMLEWFEPSHLWAPAGDEEDEEQ